LADKIDKSLLDKVTRVEVIDKQGRSYGKYKVKKVEIQLQDDDRTLKVFVWD